MSQVVSKLIDASPTEGLDVQLKKPGDRPVTPGGRVRDKPPSKRLKPLSPRIAGEIIRIKEGDGFGFIRSDGGGPEYFVHITAMLDRKAWREGQRVTFVPGLSPGGRKAAPAFSVEAVP